VPDLAKDKFHVWITKYHYLPMVVLGIVLLAIGGLPFLMWGIFVRTVLGSYKSSACCHFHGSLLAHCLRSSDGYMN
jgi:fatty-acid desaturase